MTNLTAFDPHASTTPEDRLAVEICLHRILDAAKAGDADLLASHHLCGPKFTKFDDFEPLDRQEADAARAGEDAVANVDNFHYKVDGLRIDVFGPAAIATFVLAYGFVGRRANRGTRSQHARVRRRRSRLEDRPRAPIPVQVEPVN